MFWWIGAFERIFSLGPGRGRAMRRWGGKGIGRVAVSRSYTPHHQYELS